MKALLIHPELMPALLALPDAQLGNLMRAAIGLVAHDVDEPPTDPAVATFAWSVLREKLIANGRKYDEEAQRRSDHARRAAQAKYGTTSVERATEARFRRQA